MSAPHAITLLGPRAAVEAALRGVDSSRVHARAVLDGLVALARQEAALSLRLAMVLAWIKRQDLAGLGYPSFAAFCRERVAWADSWLRDLVRLVESPLDLVKAAACRDLLPLRLAVKAPGQVRPEEQAAWLLDPVVTQAAPRPLERFEGDDAVVIQRARKVARLCIGRAASVAEIDEWILATWRGRVPVAAVLSQARERPSKPERDALSWGWCAEDPAEALLGPWTEPASLAEAVERVESIEAIRVGRAAVLARAWATTEFHALWIEAGCESAHEFARDVLGWSRRTAQRQKRLGWALQWYPELDRAIDEGLYPGAVALLAGVVAEPTAGRWVAVAQRVGRLELARAVADARYDRRTLERYERAIALADRWAGARPGGSASPFAPAGNEPLGGGEPVPSAGPPGGGAPSAGGPVGDGEHAPPAGGPVGGGQSTLRVALPHADVPRPEVSVRAPRDLPVAARWLIENVRIEAQRGFAQVKERDGWRCQNPECARASLRNEAHHIHPRSLGGSDDLENGVTVCRVCHLRGLHANGGLAVERVEVAPGVEALWWRYPGGRAVLTFRAVPA